jgi:carbon monoxide dehydrogenase subunit G
MQLEGSHTFPAQRQRVWDALMDPAILQSCLPGCDELQPVGDGHYRVVLRAGVGAVKGTFQGEIQVKDPQPPESYILAVDAKSTVGFVRGEGRITLQEQGDQTMVAYTGDVHVGGTIAAVGQRLVGATARLLVGQFFDCVARRVAALPEG